MEVHFVSQHIRAYIGLHNLDESCLFSCEHGKVAKIFSLLNSSSNKEMNEREILIFWYARATVLKDYVVSKRP